MTQAVTNGMRVLHLSGPHGRPDLIECDGQRYAPQETCTYEPTEFATRFDEKGEEVETYEPAEDCDSFSCSACGYEMRFDYDIGWFDDYPPYKPYFKFCPNCGARVVSLDERPTTMSVL